QCGRNAFCGRPRARFRCHVYAWCVAFENDVAFLNDKQTHGDLRRMPATLSVEGEIGGSVESALIDGCGESLRLNEIAVRPGDLRRVSIDGRHVQNGEVGDVAPVLIGPE